MNEVVWKANETRVSTLFFGIAEERLIRYPFSRGSSGRDFWMWRRGNFTWVGGSVTSGSLEIPEVQPFSARAGSVIASISEKRQAPDEQSIDYSVRYRV